MGQFTRSVIGFLLMGCGACAIVMGTLGLYMGANSGDPGQMAGGCLIVCIIGIPGLFACWYGYHLVTFEGHPPSPPRADLAANVQQHSGPPPPPPPSNISGPGWWGTRSREFRLWLLGSMAWMALVLIYVHMVDPFNNGSWHYIRPEQVSKMTFAMLLPVFAATLRALYLRFGR